MRTQAPPPSSHAISLLAANAQNQAPGQLFTSPSKKQPFEDSPDPLVLKSGDSIRTVSGTAVTPRKRKFVGEVQTPVKRLHSMKSLSSSSLIEKSSATRTPKSSQSGAPITPSSSTASLSGLSRASLVSTPTPRRINLAYVELPARPYLTPKSSRKLDSDDLGGYGTENDSPIKRMGINNSARSSARRTGDRDERGIFTISFFRCSADRPLTVLGPLEKLTSLIDDIFEAEDSLPPEVEASDLNHDFFSPLSPEYSRPLLASTIIRKLIKYIGHVARPTKRLRQATGGVSCTPRAKGRMADLDVQQLSRLLKILDRSVKAGEDLDPFPHIPASNLPSPTKSSPKKPTSKKNSKAKKGERRSRSATPKQENSVEDEDHSRSISVPGHADFDKPSSQLDAARDSLLAADCCIALLGSDRLPKQVRTTPVLPRSICLIILLVIFGRAHHGLP